MHERRSGRGISATRRMVLGAVFAALAYAVIVAFRFKVQFLTFDLKDAVITVAGLLLGPATAFVISLLVTLLEAISLSDTAIYGFIMNFASSATFSVVCSLVYTYRKRISGAVLGLGSAVVALTGVMLLLNLVVTPYYMGVKATEVAAMIPTLLLPFNLIKALANSALVLILYKPISRAMQAAGFLPRDARVSHDANQPQLPSKRRLWVSIAVTAAGLLLLIAALLAFFTVLDGRVGIFEDFFRADKASEAVSFICSF